MYSNEIINKISCICIPKLSFSKINVLIQCDNCETYQHEVCMMKNKNIRPYLCPACLLWYIDPFRVPVKILCQPYKIISNRIDNKMDNKFTKTFSIDTQTVKNIKLSKNKLLVQVRCIKLNAIHEHVWP